MDEAKKARLREKILADFRRARDLLGHVPARREYYKCIGGIGLFNRPQCEQKAGFGNFGALKAAAEGLPLGYDRIRDPAAFVNLTQADPALVTARASDSSLSEHIAELIEHCAQEMNRDPCDLTWSDFQEYTKYAWGKSAAGLTPRDLTRVGGFNTVRDAYFPPKATSIQVEKTRLREHAVQNRKIASWETKQKYLIEQIERLAEKIFAGRIEPYRVKPGSEQISDVFTTVWSDDHFGADIQSKETGALQFGRIEEARRAASIVKQVLEKVGKRSKSAELNMLVLGDEIQNQLHDYRDGAVTAEQACRAMHILFQVIAHFSDAFAVVKVWFATGNHGRLTARHHGRATNEKFDSIETILYYGVKLACAKLGNVECSIPTTPFGVYEVHGKKILFTHGDTVFNAGSPGKTVKTEAIENQINRMSASLSDFDEYAAVIIGHLHFGSVLHLNNGAAVITNPALCPIGPFSVSCGYFESTCGHWFFSSTPEAAVDEFKLMKVDASTDRDESLDAIISPWRGY